MISVLTLAAVALRALLWGAAPLGATAAGAPRTRLTRRRHLLPWRSMHRSCRQSVCYDTVNPTTHRAILYRGQYLTRSYVYTVPSKAHGKITYLTIDLKIT